eukprot:TRINITY_DN14219_c0_g1_i9.p1 TRINITY_DN14219_c0_g1~~TRINITY_DN14219_c0_g1_i9.p1  ORF type:complete len:519 (-),score=116.87 TRINITY_DN14219_c0_g1_i9:466-2022(-)
MQTYLEENKFLDKNALYDQYFDASTFGLDEDYQPEESAEVPEVTLTAYQYSSMENFVKEKDLILSLIKELTSSSEADAKNPSSSALELDKSRNVSFGIIRSIEKYQEQSGLLDSILEKMVTPLMEFLLKFAVHASKTHNYSIPSHVGHVFEVLYSLLKVRGYKAVTKYMPHEAADLEYCLELLTARNMADTSQWYAAYVLQLWMSILVLVPFDMQAIDTDNKLTNAIINHSLEALLTSGKCRQGAAIMLAKYITRPDIVKAGYLKEVLHERLKVGYLGYSADPVTADSAVGYLLGIVEILKTGERKELMVDAKGLTALITEEAEHKLVLTNTQLRKFKVKLAERIGLVLLKPRVAAWRYQRGYRSLLDNLEKKPAPAASSEKIEEAKEDDFEIECAAEVEAILGYLLNMIKDKHTVVRWSAAPGDSEGCPPLRQPKRKSNVRCSCRFLSPHYTSPPYVYPCSCCGGSRGWLRLRRRTQFRSRLPWPLRSFLNLPQEQASSPSYPRANDTPADTSKQPL